MSEHTHRLVSTYEAFSKRQLIELLLAKNASLDYLQNTEIPELKNQNAKLIKAFIEITNIVDRAYLGDTNE